MNLNKRTIPVITALVASACLGQSYTIENYANSIDNFYSYNVDKIGKDCTFENVSPDQNFSMTYQVSRLLSKGVNENSPAQFTKSFCKDHKTQKANLLKFINLIQISDKSTLSIKENRILTQARLNVINRGYFIDDSNRCMFAYYDSNFTRRSEPADNELYCGIIRNTKKSKNELIRYNATVPLFLFARMRFQSIENFSTMLNDNEALIYGNFYNNCIVPEKQMTNFAKSNKGYLGEIGYSDLSKFINESNCQSMALNHCNATFTIRNKKFYMEDDGKLVEAITYASKLKSTNPEIIKYRDYTIRMIAFCSEIMK